MKLYPYIFSGVEVGVFEVVLLSVRKLNRLKEPMQIQGFLVPLVRGRRKPES